MPVLTGQEDSMSIVVFNVLFSPAALFYIFS